MLIHYYTGISNFSTLVIKGLGFGELDRNYPTRNMTNSWLFAGTLETALLGIPQGVLIMIWIGAGAIINGRLPKNSRTWVCALFMLPTIAGSLGFLLAPTNAYVGRLICL